MPQGKYTHVKAGSKSKRVGQKTKPSKRRTAIRKP